MEKTVLALRHLAFEDLGVLYPVFESNGYSIRYLDVGFDDLTEREVLGADLVVVLGGPIGANDGEKYPVVDTEISLLQRRMSDEKPTLGICLGAQLMARSLGAEVARGERSEIGYAPIELTAAGENSPLRHLRNTAVLHWHNDGFQVPVGAERLAATAVCSNQAFSYGRHILGLQFHLETPLRDIERWLIGHAEALAAAGVDPRLIREQAASVAPTLELRAARVIAGWLDGLQ